MTAAMFSLWAMNFSKASSPFSAMSTSNPATFNISPRAERMTSSSSASKICPWGVVLDKSVDKVLLGSG